MFYTGNGEHGVPAVLPINHNETTEKYLYDVNGFNGYLSDLIALDRAVPDIRHPELVDSLYINIILYA